MVSPEWFRRRTTDNPSMKTSSFHIARLLLLALAFAAAPAGAAEFTLFVHESKADYALRADKEKAPAYWAAHTAVAKAMADAGIMRGGTALHAVASAKVVGQPPKDDKKTELGGYYVIEVADMDAALKWAAKVPVSKGGSVVVVPHYPNPTMPAK